MCPDDITPADTDDIDTDGVDTDGVDLDPDGAPCLVCGQTVPGPGPALLCPDCAAVAGTDTTDTGTGTGGTAELLPALWPGSAAQVHGPGTGNYTDAIVRVLSDRGHRWTVETSDGTRLTINPTSLRATDQRFMSTVPDYVPGSVVTVTPPIAPHPAGQRFVVTAVRVASLTVTKLGGERGTTYRVPPTACRPADPDA